MGSSAGGVFLPNDPPPSTGQVLTNPVIGPSAGVAVATAAPFTTPAISVTSQDLIATGATGSTAAVVSAAMPVLVHANSTGVSGAGVNLPVPTVGQFAVIMNDMTGVLNVYSVGATINGTTGTTAATITSTGNRTGIALCTVAGAWILRGNT